MSAKETFSKMADIAREQTEEHRFTLGLVKLTEFRTTNHYVYLPARTNALAVNFMVDTGSKKSVISKNFVPTKQIQPCDTKELCYL